MLQSLLSSHAKEMSIKFGADADIHVHMRSRYLYTLCVKACCLCVISQDGCRRAEEIFIKPVLLSKGTARVAIYGLGNIRDERLHQVFYLKDKPRHDKIPSTTRTHRHSQMNAFSCL